MRKKIKYKSKKGSKVEILDSTYEHRRAKILDASPKVISWTKNHGIRIPYKSGRKIRHYIPDFLIVMSDGRHVIEETKGYIWDPIKHGKKHLAARIYCASKGWEYRILFNLDIEIEP